MTCLLRRDPLFSERQPGQAAIREPERGKRGDIDRDVIGETGRNIPGVNAWLMPGGAWSWRR